MKSLFASRVAQGAIMSIFLYGMCAVAHAHSFIPEERSLHRNVVTLSRVGDSPQTIFPANNETIYCPGTTLKLRWHEVPGITNYFVEIASDAGMTNTVLKTMTQFDTTLSFTLSKTVSTYYWTISTGATTSEVSTFRLRTATQVQLVDKYNGKTVASALVPFRWTTDPAASSYNIEIMSPSVEARTTSTADTSITLTLVRQELVRWRVQPVCSSGAGTWTERDSVIVAAEINDVTSESEIFDLHVYPHPVQSSATVLVPHNSTTIPSVRVSDALGQTIDIPIRCSDDQWFLDCSSCSNGLYFLSFQFANTCSTTMFMVSR